MVEILKCLKKRSRRPAREIAKETGMSLATVCQRLISLAVARDVVMWRMTRFEGGKAIDAWSSFT